MEKSLRSQLENIKSNSLKPETKEIFDFLSGRKTKQIQENKISPKYMSRELKKEYDVLSEFNQYAKKSFPTTMRKNLRKNGGTNTISVGKEISVDSKLSNYLPKKIILPYDKTKPLIKVRTKEELEIEFERDLVIKARIDHFEEYGIVEKQIKAKKEIPFLEGETIERKILKRRK